ncbi:MAG: hypothetical protein WCO48_02330 [Candidatus Taylorbacteria bacterium]
MDRSLGKLIQRRLAEADFNARVVVVCVSPAKHRHQVNHSYNIRGRYHGHFMVQFNMKTEEICTLGVFPEDGVTLFPERRDHINLRATLESQAFKSGAPCGVLIKRLSYDRRAKFVVLELLRWLKQEMKIISRSLEGSSEDSHRGEQSLAE